MNSVIDFFFSSRRRHTRCALVTGVQTCALPISAAWPSWMRRNLFRGGRQSILTIAILAMTAAFAGKGLSWLLFDATFAGGAADCRLASGACWPFLRENARMILFGTYPEVTPWRSAVAADATVLCLVFFFVPR